MLKILFFIMNKILKNLKENWLNYSILFLLVVMIFGSSVGNMGVSSFSSKSLAMNDAYYGNNHYGSGFAPDVEDRKITKNGNLNLDSDNYNLSKENILTVSEKYSVIFLTNNEYSDKYNYKNLNLRGKVNAENLEVYLNEIKEFGEITSFEIYSSDVTESYVNYDERIKRYSNQLLRYVDMLNGEISVEDEIQVQKRIDELENQLFYLKKNFENLDERVVYSDVSIRLVEEKSIFHQVDFIDFKNGFKAFIESLGAALWFIVYVAGFVLPFVVIYGVYRLFRKFVK